MPNGPRKQESQDKEEGQGPAISHASQTSMVQSHSRLRVCLLESQLGCVAMAMEEGRTGAKGGGVYTLRGIGGEVLLTL